MRWVGTPRPILALPGGSSHDAVATGLSLPLILPGAPLPARGPQAGDPHPHPGAWSPALVLVSALAFPRRTRAARCPVLWSRTRPIARFHLPPNAKS